MKTQTTFTDSDLRNFALDLDCFVKTDADGDKAVMRHHYRDGNREVRYAPDPCDFHSLAFWETAVANGSATEFIC